MSKSLPRRVYLAELDALLDTRAAILNREVGDKLTYILANGYFYRNVDHYPDLPFEKFMELYRNRDKSLLVDALSTPIVRMISEYIQGVYYNTMATPYHYEPVLMINIHPYVLSKDEEKIIAQGIATKFKHKVNIELINLPYKKIGPKFLKDNDVAYLALYNYVEYLNLHLDGDEFVKYPCPTVGLVAPRIIFAKPSNQLSPRLNDDFQSVEDIVGQFISMQYFPVKDFCMNIPIELIEAAKKGQEKANKKE